MDNSVHCHEICATEIQRLESMESLKQFAAVQFRRPVHISEVHFSLECSTGRLYGTWLYRLLKGNKCVTCIYHQLDCYGGTCA